MSFENNEFPKYEMIVDEVSDFYILKDAGLLLGDKSKTVDFGERIRTGERTTRHMKPKDEELVQRISEEYKELKSTKTK